MQKKKPWQQGKYVCKCTNDRDDYSYHHCGCLSCIQRRHEENRIRR